MVNSTDFTNRLKKILEHHQLTASMFADKIDVQRSSISHILSGRNKPSLDFILKVTNEFTDVDIYWLLNGKGIFPSNVNSATFTPS
ncbi:MAG: helix-turn-helix transcriptional regulator, partial [Flavobacteriaceae bacterium]